MLPATATRMALDAALQAIPCMGPASLIWRSSSMVIIAGFLAGYAPSNGSVRRN